MQNYGAQKSCYASSDSCQILLSNIFHYKILYKIYNTYLVISNDTAGNFLNPFNVENDAREAFRTV